MLWRGEHKHCDTNVAMPAFFGTIDQFCPIPYTYSIGPSGPKATSKGHSIDTGRLCSGWFKTTKNIVASHLQSIRAQRTLKDNTHPSHSLFTLLPSGKTHRSICCRTTRLQSSFIAQSVRLLDLSVHHRKNVFLCSIKGLQLARVPLQHRSRRMYWSGIFHKSLSSVAILTALCSFREHLARQSQVGSPKNMSTPKTHNWPWRRFFIGCWKKFIHCHYLLLKSGLIEFVEKRPTLG